MRRIVLGICILCITCLCACSRDEKPKMSPLMKAVATGNAPRVEKLLAQGADVLEVHPQTQETPLMLAVKYPIILEMLLEKDDSNINAQTKDGWTALIFASTLPTPKQSVELLLKHGADTEIKGRNGRTAISWAAGSGHTEALQALITAKADINTLDNEHQTPLMWAATIGNKNAVRLLLQAGADVNIVDNNGSAVFMRSNRTTIPMPGNIQLNTSLVSYGLSPLHWAAMKDNTHLINSLIRQDMSPDITDPNGQTPLMRAAILGQNKAIRTLLNKGADIHARDKNGNTPLMWAVSSSDYPKTVKLLLMHGARIDDKNNEGITPLMWAAALGLNNSVKLLLEKQANPNLLDNKGRSAFTWTVQNGHLDTTYLLLDSGRGKRKKISFYVPGMFIFNLPEKFEHSGIKLDIEKPISGEGENPLMLAIRFNNLSLVKRLIEMGSNINATDIEGLTPITLAALYESSSQIINLLVQAGANVNNQSDEGKDFPLLFAAAYNNKELIEELLKNGANVHLKNIDGETPLFRASTLYFQINLIKDMEKDGLTPEPLPQDAAQKHAEIAKILIQHGANVNETNNENKTPLLWAVSLPGHAPIVKVLLDAGADIHHQNNKGRDALAIAKDTNDPEILKLLQEKLSQE